MSTTFTSACRGKCTITIIYSYTYVNIHASVCAHWHTQLAHAYTCACMHAYTCVHMLACSFNLVQTYHTCLRARTRTSDLNTAPGKTPVSTAMRHFLDPTPSQLNNQLLLCPPHDHPSPEKFDHGFYPSSFRTQACFSLPKRFFGFPSVILGH